MGRFLPHRKRSKLPRLYSSCRNFPRSKVCPFGPFHDFCSSFVVFLEQITHTTEDMRKTFNTISHADKAEELFGSNSTSRFIHIVELFWFRELSSTPHACTLPSTTAMAEAQASGNGAVQSSGDAHVMYVNDVLESPTTEDAAPPTPSQETTWSPVRVPHNILHSSDHRVLSLQYVWFLSGPSLDNM